MADRVHSSTRSLNMAAVRSKSTRPELIVRRIAYSLGYRYRLHGRDLPGKPDLVFRKKRKVIFVHGCFWHRHSRCVKASNPATRIEFWQGKFEANMKRDRKTQAALEGQGWEILIIWQCELKDLEALAKCLKNFLAD